MLRVCLICVFLATGAFARSPIAEVVCAPTKEMRSRLTGEFGEVRQGTGIRNPEEIMELWARPTGAWTLVLTYANGQSCIVATGEHWDPAETG